MRFIFSAVIVFFFTAYVFSQDSSRKNKPRRLTAFPVVFYSPETSVAVGGFAAYTFRNKKDTAQRYPSQIQFGAAYTFNKQLLLYAPFRIYTPGSKFTAYGEVGYYKYSYYFFGIGNEQPADYKELYKVNYPRVRLNVLRKINPKLYAGLRYWLEDYRVVETEPGKQLSSGTIEGSTRSFISGIGPALNYDTRDNIFYAGSGVFVDAGAQFYGNATGSNYQYNRYTLDASTYLSTKRKNVWAFNLFADMVDGNAPFSQLALLGGNKKMRGFYEGRYRDKNLLAAGTEYRFKIYKRFGGTVFANAGAVNDQLKNMAEQIRTTYGAGLRFALNPAEKINLRLDAGFGKNSTAFYFTIGEAF